MRFIPILIGTVVAASPCAFGEPANPLPQSPKTETLDGQPQKKRGFFSLFKKKEESKPNGGKPGVESKKQSAPSALAGDSSERRRKTYVTTRERVPFYRWGPIQSGGPDRHLEDKLLVTIVKEDGDWTEIQLDDGERGVVPSDWIRKAKASDLPVEVVKKKQVVLPSESVVVFESVPAPPLPELEAFDLGDLEDGASLEISENPLLFPSVSTEDLQN